MLLEHHRRTPRGVIVAAVVLESLLALGAIGGGVALMVRPRGELLRMPVSLLDGSSFTTFFGPGLILFTVLGIGATVTAVLAWRRHRWAPLLTLMAGVALLGWIAIEIAVVGYATDPPLQLIYLGLGISLVLLGATWLEGAGLPVP